MKLNERKTKGIIQQIEKWNSVSRIANAGGQQAMVETNPKVKVYRRLRRKMRQKNKKTIDLILPIPVPKVTG